MTKTLNNSTLAQTRDQVSDIEVVGDGDMFKLLCKASSAKEGWMKSTKAMEIPGVGCVVQVTTHQMNIAHKLDPYTEKPVEQHVLGHVVAEAVTFVPGVCIVDDVNGGRKLVAILSEDQ